jgi:Pyruvate/2-oxoacid:ferredoxin oxidoreductase gamma subunit
VLSGEAGQGIQTIESMLTAFAKKGRYSVFATKEYMSRVRGGCNSTEIRISSKRVTSRVGRIDILVALTKAAIPHLRERITDKTLVLGEEGIVGYEGMVDLPLTAIAQEIGNPIYSNSVAVGADMRAPQAGSGRLRGGHLGLLRQEGMPRSRRRTPRPCSGATSGDSSSAAASTSRSTSRPTR